MNDGLNNTEQMYSPCIVCYRVNGVTILRSEETGELRGIEETLETVCPYSVEEYALTKALMRCSIKGIESCWKKHKL